jgi:chromosome segregation ATPase
MANEEALISGIENKIRKLLELIVQLKEENANLHQHIEVLEKDSKTLTTELENKRNELLNITLANTLEAEFGVEESKEKIDNLIIEIDKCIEVMSD